MTGIENLQSATAAQPRPRQRPSRARVHVEQLMMLIGPEPTIELIRTYASRRLPTIRQLLKVLRRQTIIAGYTRGASVPWLSRKYQLSVSSVRRIIDEHLRLVREAQRMDELIRESRNR